MTALLLTVDACFLPSQTASADDLALEYKVKAGYLFNFAKFVEWPSSAFSSSNAPFVVGLVGEDPFGPVLDELLRGRTVNGRSLVIRRLDPQDDLSHCHMLFVSRSEKDRTAKLFETLHGHAVLTIGEINRFGQLGGMVSFTLVSGQVKVETNPEEATVAGLKVSSKLLAASRTVKTAVAR